MHPDLVRSAAEIEPELIALRRALHAAPEPGLHLPQTQAMLLAALAGLDLEITTGETVSSITVVIRGALPGPVVLLRADMDGLPVDERTGVPFASTNGAMHACGHDLHMSIMVGTVRLLAARRDRLAGTVLVVFQPGEEGHDGALAMIAEGVLLAGGELPKRTYALHVFSDRAHGQFFCKPGPIMAAVDELDVTVMGRGGHGAKPHTTIDPIPVALEIATALQVYVARRVDPFDPVVLTVGELAAGTARHVVPDVAYLRAGLRTFSTETREQLGEGLQALSRGIAAAHGASATTRFVSSDPTTQNDPAAAAEVREVVEGLLGAERFVPLERPETVGEDYSQFLAHVRGAMFFVGAAPAGASPGELPSNHSSLAVFDDGVVADAAAVLAQLALSAAGR